MEEPQRTVPSDARKRPSPLASSVESNAKRPKVKDAVLADLEAAIQAFKKIEANESARQADVERIQKQFGDRIHTLWMEARPHGAGWKLGPTSLSIAAGFCAEPSLDRATPTEYTEFAASPPTALAELRKRVTKLKRRALPVVWFENATEPGPTEPITVWQAVHLAADDEAAEAVKSFYARHKSQCFALPGLYYTSAPRWLGELQRDRINALCASLGHDPLFVK